MQRSSNSSRVTEDLFKNASTDTDQQELPTYDPLSHIGKKEKSRLRSAEYAIHVIPLLLVLCAIILWFFSNSPVNPGVYTNFPVTLLPIFILCSDLGFQKSDFSMLRRAKDLRIDNVGNGVNSWNRLLAGFPLGQKKKRSEGHSKVQTIFRRARIGAWCRRQLWRKVVSRQITLKQIHRTPAYNHDDSYQD
ncbi:hypothetical protein Peur_040054 [Populus x canadensis]